MGKKQGLLIVLGQMGISLLIPFTNYISKDNNIIDYMQNKDFLGQYYNYAQLKTILYFVFSILSFIVFTIILTIKKYRKNSLEKQRDGLLEMWKRTFAETLADDNNKLSNNDIDVRIFVPNSSIKNRLKKKKEFIIKNFKSLADPDITDDLCFEVSPQSEGLVGFCYQSKKIVYDDNLEETNSKNYNLSKHQQNKTSNLKFSFVCPILDINEDVIGMVAIDSKKLINIRSNKKYEKQFTTAVLNFSQLMHKNVPELFKARRALK